MVVISEQIPEMFWGLTLDEGKRYSQTAQASFHISMASIEPKSGSKDVTSIYIRHNDMEYLLCSLQQGSLFQQPLDLGFLAGESLTLFTTGKGSVHLTGYVVHDGEMGSELDSEMSDMSDMSDEEDLLMEPAAKKLKSKDVVVRVAATANGAGDFDEVDSEVSDEDSSDAELDTNAMLDMAVGDSDSEEDEDFDDQLDSEDSEEDFDEMSDTEVQRVADQVRKQMMKEETAKKGKGNESQKGKTPDGKSQKLKQEKTPQLQEKTPKQQAKTPQQQGKTPKQGKTPQQQGKTPQQQGKTPQQQGKTPQGKTPQQFKEPVKTPKQQQESKTPQKRKLPSGISVEDLKEGHGPEAKNNKMVHVYYTGKLTSGKVFDSATGGRPFKFRLGKNEVIKGWEIGLQGMKVGGKRRLTIPPNLAYGNDKSSGLPPNSTLLFDVELKAMS